MDNDEFDDMILFYASGFYKIYKKWLCYNCNDDIDVIAKWTTLFPNIF